MAQRKQFRHCLETVLAWVGVHTVPYFPRRVVLGMAAGLSSAAYFLAGRDRRIALANLDVAYGDSLSRDEKRRIAHGAFRSFGQLVFDLFWFSRFSRSRVERYVVFDPSIEIYFKTRPAVVVTAHLGNWEIMAQAMAYSGEPCVSIAAPLQNPLVDQLLYSLRGKSGQTIQTKTGAVRALLTALKRGDRTGILIDQNTLPTDGGQFVPFFGLPAPVSRAAAMLAARTGSPILFCTCIPEANGRYLLTVSEPFYVAREDAETATAEIAARVEDIIRKHPDHWLWMYKRWKYVPEGHDGKGYPFYARKSSRAAAAAA